VGGLAEALTGGVTSTMQNPGAILAFTYEGEGGAAATDQARRESSTNRPDGGPMPGPATNAGTAEGIPPLFTAQQAAAGKTAYNSNCAVCHGSTMTNGTFGPPLAGEYFRNAWFGRTVRAFYDHA
jgi:mono/diheme cytochrome c family protein